jgi:hypothetical protein
VALWEAGRWRTLGHVSAARDRSATWVGVAFSSDDRRVLRVMRQQIDVWEGDFAAAWSAEFSAGFEGFDLQAAAVTFAGNEIVALVADWQGMRFVKTGKGRHAVQLALFGHAHREGEPLPLRWSEEALPTCAPRVSAGAALRKLPSAPHGAEWLWDEITAEHVAPGGKAFVVRGPRGLYLLDAASGAVRAGPFANATPGPGVDPNDALTFEWSRDGKLLATWPRAPMFPEPGTTTDITFWRAEDGKLARRIHVGDAVVTLTWHPRDAVVFANPGYGSIYDASYWAGDAVTLWRTDTGAALGKLPGHTAVFSPDGRYLAMRIGHPSRSAKSSTQIYDAVTRAKLVELPGHASEWAADGSWVVTAEDVPVDYNYPTRTGYHLRELPSGRKRADLPPTYGLMMLYAASGVAAIVDDGDPMGPTGFDRDVTMWDAFSGKPLRTFGAVAEPDSAQWLADGAALALYASGGVGRVLAVRSGARLTIEAVRRDGACAVTAFDERGFEGDAAPIAVRLGGDLRRAQMVNEGPELEAFRRPGLWTQFLAAAQPSSSSTSKTR